MDAARAMTSFTVDERATKQFSSRPAPVRIAILCWGGANYLGVWNYYINMAKVLSEYQPHIRLVFFCPHNLSQERRREAEAATGERTFDLPPRERWRDLLALFGYWDRYFYKRCVDAEIGLVFEQAKFLGTGFPIPVLSWIGDLQHRHLPQYFSRLHRLVRDVGYRSQARLRQHVMVSSDSARRDVITFFGRGRGKIHVVPFAVTSPLAVDVKKIPLVQEKYQLPQDYLFLPNQFWIHKNHQLAFHAMHELKRRGRPQLLALSGQAHDFRYAGHADNLRALAKDLDIDSNLKWLGAIPYEDLLHLTAGARVLLNPSLFEGWSTTVEEAKCVGAPMALSDLDVHREQATGRATFFDRKDVLAMTDAIEETIASAAEAELGARLRRAQEAYRADILRYAERLSAAIHETIAEHSGGSACAALRPATTNQGRNRSQSLILGGAVY
jgi:glycosyltransferase involved in cell wall biosynthesis